MKAIVTGHKRGIGKAIFDYLKNLPEMESVEGFSKSDGYDISDANVRHMILSKCESANIFVNNAYNDHDSSQLMMLISVSELWKGTSNKIINISSFESRTFHKYGLQKCKQDDYCRSVKSPHIINMKPGYVDTDRVSYVEKPKMECSDLVDVLDFCLNSTVRIEEIKFRFKL